MIETVHYNVIIDTDLISDKTESSDKCIKELQKALFEELTKWEGVLAVSSNRVEELDLWRFNV